MNRLNDKWYRIVGIPLVALASNIIFYYDMNEKHGFKFLEDYLYTLATTFMLWEVNRQVIVFTRKRFASLQHSVKRITWTTIGVLLVTTLLMTSLSAFYDITMWWGYHYTLKNYFYNIFVALTYGIIVGGIYEATYYFRKWRNVEVQAALLKKENLQSQLDSLKQQVSPHFLFNSLNTLSSLMRKDVDRAEMFLDEMSKVYRYLLRNNEESLIDLETELQFIESYFHLLTTRYGDAIKMRISAGNNAADYLLPPLTLQLLVENAVKHNVIEKTAPLLINIDIAGDEYLVVANTLQPKIIKVHSNNVGLNNITAKYRLLGYAGIAVNEQDGLFSVKIPLLKKKSY